MPPSQDQTVEAVLAFVNARTWEESKRIVETHVDLLLSDAADEVFGALLEQFQEDANAARLL